MIKIIHAPLLQKWKQGLLKKMTAQAYTANSPIYHSPVQTAHVGVFFGGIQWFRATVEV